MKVEQRTERFPFTSQQACILAPPAVPQGDAAPPLLVVIHGYAQTGHRQQRWMGRAVPPHFAAAFPDGFHHLEVRAPERKPRMGFAWYIFTADRPTFLASLAEAETALWTLVDRVADALGADPSRVWLAGFSQGAYLVNYASMMRPERVAGWIAQCGNMRADYLQGTTPDLSGKPVLLQYGEHDQALPADAATSCRDLIASYGADVTFSMHDAAHVITPGMADETNAFLVREVPGV